MATRRIISSEKTILERDLHPEEKSNIAPAVPKYVSACITARRAHVPANLGFIYSFTYLFLGSNVSRLL